MFAKAIEKIEGCIRPVVSSRRHYDDSIETSGGTLIILNKDGWFLSSAHVFEAIPLSQLHTKEMEEYENKLKKLNGDKLPKKELRKLQPNQKWIKTSSIWPGSNEEKVVDLGVIPEADLLLGRLENFKADSIKEYPTFKTPTSNLRVGTSLCKLGYAFTELETTFDKATGGFNLDFKNLVPFPLDGIYTRNILFKTPKELKEKDIEIKFLETSTPGLRGHSGAPVFDTDGNIWAIQSRTTHLPLGFSPRLKKGDKIITENQFLNVGWGVHPDVIAGFLKERSIEFKQS
jgi:hypothetical protein